MFNKDSDIENVKNIPSFLRGPYRAMLLSTTKSTMMEKFCSCSCFSNSFIIFMNEFLNIQVMNQTETCKFLEDNKILLSKLPPAFLYANILPGLINKYKFGGAYFEIVVTAHSIISEMPNDFKIDNITKEFLLSLFLAKDRAIKALSFNNHEKIIRYFDKKQIEEHIFPCILGGFSDPSIYVREQTLKSVVLTISYISSNCIKNKLLPLLARSQGDKNPLIRANTNVCIGKVNKFV
ncbi:hypothetical protein HZS_6707 [Henneguya salminicola]|nr:hypothetical protein HZS_6707 [Henneguya salminicola]